MKNNRINLVLMLMAFVWVMLLCSCRAVKRNQTSSSASVVIVDTDSTGVEAKSQVIDSGKMAETVDETVKIIKKQIRIIPIDPSKPSSATTPDGCKYDLNNAQLDITETNESADKNSTLLQDYKKVQNSEIKAVNKNKVKAKMLTDAESLNIEKEEVSWFKFWWLYVIVIGILLWIFKDTIIYCLVKKKITKDVE